MRRSGGVGVSVGGAGGGWAVSAGDVERRGGGWWVWEVVSVADVSRGLRGGVRVGEGGVGREGGMCGGWGFSWCAVGWGVRGVFCGCYMYFGCFWPVRVGGGAGWEWLRPGICGVCGGAGGYVGCGGLTGVGWGAGTCARGGEGSGRRVRIYCWRIIE